VRALAPHQSGSGSIQAQCHMGVEFVGSGLALRGFLWVLCSSSLYKNQHSKF